MAAWSGGVPVNGQDMLGLGVGVGGPSFGLPFKVSTPPPEQAPHCQETGATVRRTLLDMCFFSWTRCLCTKPPVSFETDAFFLWTDAPELLRQTVITIAPERSLSPKLVPRGTGPFFRALVASFVHAAAGPAKSCGIWPASPSRPDLRRRGSKLSVMRRSMGFLAPNHGWLGCLPQKQVSAWFPPTLISNNSFVVFLQKEAKRG